MNNHWDSEPQFEAQIRLWEHKVFLAVLGVLVVAGLVVSGNGF